MSTASRKIHSDRNDDKSTTRKVASVAHQAIDDAAEKAEPVEKNLRNQASKAGEQIEATQAAATEQVQQSLKNVETFVRDKPVAATGIAFAAGVLTTLILRR